MEILDHTNEHQPTLFRDVCDFHVGKWVKVFTNHPTPITGTLNKFNGAILHVIEIGNINTYIPVVEVRAISGDDKP